MYILNIQDVLAGEEQVSLVALFLDVYVDITV